LSGRIREKGLVEVFLQLEVENDATNLAARPLDFPCYLVVQPVKIGVVSGFLGLHKSVVGGLPMGDQLRPFEKAVAVLCQS